MCFFFGAELAGSVVVVVLGVVDSTVLDNGASSDEFTSMINETAAILEVVSTLSTRSEKAHDFPEKKPADRSILALLIFGIAIASSWRGTFLLDR